MTGRLLLKAALFGFVAVSVGSMLHKAALSRAAALKPGPAAQAAQAAASPQPGIAQRTAVIYYFYTNTRCASCTQLEAYTRETVDTLLSAGYKGWRVEFRGVNVEEPANAHFIGEYSLESKAVVVQKFYGAKPLDWAKLDKAWTLLGDRAAFVNYVAAETRRALDKQ